MFQDMYIYCSFLASQQLSAVFHHITAAASCRNTIQQAGHAAVAGQRYKTTGAFLCQVKMAYGHFISALVGVTLHLHNLGHAVLTHLHRRT
jgi:hypothetical protein